MEPTEFRSYVRICHTLGKTEDLPLFPVTDAMINNVKQRVNLARDIDKLELTTKRKHSEIGWLDKAIDEMDIIIDERDKPFVDHEVDATQRKLLNVKRKQLKALLVKPVFPTQFSFKYPSLNKVEVKMDDDAIAVMKAANANYARSSVGTVMQKLKKQPHEIKRDRKRLKQQKKDLKKKEKKKRRQREEEKRSAADD